MDSSAFTIKEHVDPLVCVEDSNTPPVRETLFKTAKSFLSSHPLGPYTCLRAHWRSDTTHSYQPLQLDFHLDRLEKGFHLSFRQRDNIQAIECTKVASSRTKTLVDKLLQYCGQRRACPAVTLLLSVLWSYDNTASNNQLLIAIHVCRLPQISPDQRMEIRRYALVYGEPRALPACKHTSWIMNRRHIEEHKEEMQLELSDGNFTEVLLVDIKGVASIPRLLEGLVTNFFVVRDGQVWTAQEGILNGSMRQLVIKACTDLQIPIIQESPSYKDRELWQAAFLTSVVRVVSPIDVIVWDPSIVSRKIAPEAVLENSNEWEKTDLARQATKRSNELVEKIHVYIVSQLFETE